MFNKLHIESFCRSKYRRFVTHPNGCYLCWTNFGTIDEYQTHLKQHLENVKINGFNASWKALGTLELLSFNVTTHPNNKSLCFNLNNQANKDIKITDMVIYNENLKFKSVDSVDFPIVLKPDDEVTLLRDLDQFSKHNHVVIVFEETSYNIFESVQSYHVMQASKKQKELLCELNEKGSTKKSEFPINNPEDNPKSSYDDLINELHEKCGKFRQIQENVYSYIETCDVSTQTNQIAAQFEKLQQIIQTQADLIKELQTKLSFYEHHESVYKNDDTRSLYYTGLHFKTLNLLYNALEPAFPSHGNKKLTKFQCIVLTLMRMRLGLSFVDLSYRFNVSVQTISRDFHTTLSIMYTNLKQFIVWPEREILRKTMPRLFIEKLGHRKLTCIIDCFEVFVQRPAEQIDNCKVWSDYKHHQTVKFLIAITPQGSVSFISQANVGRTSDKDITNTSGFLDKLSPGDYVAADRGFTVETEIQMLHAELIIPTFVKGESSYFHVT